MCTLQFKHLLIGKHAVNTYLLYDAFLDLILYADSIIAYHLPFHLLRNMRLPWTVYDETHTHTHTHVLSILSAHALIYKSLKIN